MSSLFQPAKAISILYSFSLNYHGHHKLLKIKRYSFNLIVLIIILILLLNHLVNMNIAIIPARKGSERMPNKNRSKINGSSIFKIALDQALRVKIFDRIIVTNI